MELRRRGLEEETVGWVAESAGARFAVGRRVLVRGVLASGKLLRKAGAGAGLGQAARAELLVLPGVARAQAG